jgi:hypothetical protein
MEHGRVKQAALSRVTYDCLHTLHYTIMVLSPNKQWIEQLARKPNAHSPPHLAGLRQRFDIDNAFSLPARNGSLINTSKSHQHVIRQN